MSVSGLRSRPSSSWLLSVLSVLSVVACYRAQIDVRTDGSAGQAGAGFGAAGSGGSADAPADGGDAGCLDAAVEDAQFECQTVLPTKSECASQDANGWNGCVDGGCSVCVDVLRKYPYYFSWHPCCEPNLYCAASAHVKCNARCPAPTEQDRLRPCFFGRVN